MSDRPPPGWDPSRAIPPSPEGWTGSPPTQPLPPGPTPAWGPAPAPPPQWNPAAGQPGYGGYPGYPPVPYPGADPRKSKIAAGLLALLVGGFGIHTFYLGYTGKALAQLLMSVLTCFILYPVSLIWSIIEGVQILTGSIATDARGIRLKD